MHRWVTSGLALLVGLLYCTIRDYGPAMLMLSMGVYVYKIVDGIADVYEGRLQQADKLYLAGISQALRSVAAIAAFAILLFLTRSTAIAAVGMAIATVATLVLVSVPSPSSRPRRPARGRRRRSASCSAIASRCSRRSSCST